LLDQKAVKLRTAYSCVHTGTQRNARQRTAPRSNCVYLAESTLNICRNSLVYYVCQWWANVDCKNYLYLNYSYYLLFPMSHVNLRTCTMRNVPLALRSCGILRNVAAKTMQHTARHCIRINATYCFAWVILVMTSINQLRNELTGLNRSLLIDILSSNRQLHCEL